MVLQIFCFKDIISICFILKDYCASDIEDLLQTLSQALLNETFTIPIAIAFEDTLLLLVTNALEGGDDNDDFFEFQWKCIALAKLMHFSLCVKR